MTNRRAITHAQRAALRDHFHEDPDMKITDLQAWYYQKYDHPLNLTQIYHILSHDYDYVDSLPKHQLHRKRKQTERWPELTRALYEWIQLAEGVISWDQLRTKGREIWGNRYPKTKPPKFSDTWITNFQRRHNIQNLARYGENGKREIWKASRQKNMENFI